MRKVKRKADIRTKDEDIRARHIRRQRKKRKRRMFFRLFLLLFLLFITSTIIMFLTPWFNISEIEVVGNSAVSTDTILTQSEIYLGNNIFKISTSNAQDKIASMPYIKSVSVERKMPKKILINVVESHQAAYIEYGGGYAVIDEDGKGLEILSSPPSQGIKIIGAEIKEFFPGKKIIVDSDEKFDIIILYIGELERTNLYSGVNMIDITSTVDTKFAFENRLTVFCGDTRELYRKLLTFTEIAYNQLSPNARGEIDLRIDAKAYYRP